eukprot:1159846-Pelagomonas_calceolata.AAC.8
MAMRPFCPTQSFAHLQAMRVDVSPKRAAAFAKRLLQVAIPAPAHFACGALLLLSEVLKVRITSMLTHNTCTCTHPPEMCGSQIEWQHKGSVRIACLMLKYWPASQGAVLCRCKHRLLRSDI